MLLAGIGAAATVVVAVDASDETALEAGCGESADTKLLIADEKLAAEFEGTGTGTTAGTVVVALGAGLEASVPAEDATLAASELGDAAALDSVKAETKLLACIDRLESGDGDGAAGMMVIGWLGAGIVEGRIIAVL